MTETQQRFLKAIAERLGERRLVEVRLFPSIRQGQHESGVAVVAVEEPPPAVDAIEEPPPAVAAVEESPAAVDAIEESPAAVDAAEALPATVAMTRAAIPRLSILTARFRLTLKGPDRGKWDFSMVHDADAPLQTVESVVRGVARRVGDDGEPELLSPEAFARVLSEPWWSATA